VSDFFKLSNIFVVTRASEVLKKAPAMQIYNAVHSPELTRITTE